MKSVAEESAFVGTLLVDGDPITQIKLTEITLNTSS